MLRRIIPIRTRPSLFVVGAMVFSMVLAGCGTTGAILTGGVTNPVTPGRALALHTAFKDSVEIPVALYVSLPRCSKAAPPCSSQAVVNQARVYVNKAVVALRSLDTWAEGNSTLNGQALFQAATAAVAVARNYGITSAISGVK